jgi:hypothetical protein
LRVRARGATQRPLRRQLLRILQKDAARHQNNLLGFEWLLILAKRLEQDTFPWPKSGDELDEMTRQHIRLLLRRIDV